MIYEGALIQRLVAPNWPGDPTLAAAGAPEFRTEWVRSDEPGKPVTWTLKREEGHHYPTHLVASKRAKELGAHCHASVVGGDRSPIFQQDGEGVSRLAHNQKIVGSNPTPATNLPVEGSSSGRASKQLSSHKTVGKGSRAAGKILAQSDRLDALRTAANKDDAERFWWKQGAYA